MDDHQRHHERQRLANKQRGLCASCRTKLPVDFCIRREVYRVPDGDAITVCYAQCATCFDERRPRSDGYRPGTPHDKFFAQFKRP